MWKTYHTPCASHLGLPPLALWQVGFLLPTYYSLLTTHYLLLTTDYSLLTTHYSLLTTHYSLLTTHYSLLTTHYSLPLLTTYYYSDY